MGETMKKIIRALRTLQGYTLQEVAVNVGVNKSSIGNFEIGISTLGNETIQKICQFLNFDLKKGKLIQDRIFYFNVKAVKDWIDVEEIETLVKEEILKISQVVIFESWEGKEILVKYVLLYEYVTNNYYVLVFKKPVKKEVVESVIGSLFAGVIVKKEYMRDDLKEKLEKRKATIDDLSPYLYFTYCYNARPVLVSRNYYVIEVPIHEVLTDFFTYIKHEVDPQKKKNYLRLLIQKVLQETERLSEEEYQREFEKRYKRACEVFNLLET